MKGHPEERAVAAAEYIIENRATVRQAARRFGVSKSTVHKDVSERLAGISPALFELVKGVLEVNKRERHLRGGEATKQKYRRMRARSPEEKSG